jgi:hypothetical protein
VKRHSYSFSVTAFVAAPEGSELSSDSVFDSVGEFVTAVKAFQLFLFYHRPAVFSVQMRERSLRKIDHDKKHWNAVARDLFDSGWNHYAFSCGHWRNRNGDPCAHNRHFNLGR